MFFVMLFYFHQDTAFLSERASNTIVTIFAILIISNVALECSLLVKSIAENFSCKKKGKKANQVEPDPNAMKIETISNAGANDPKQIAKDHPDPLSTNGLEKKTSITSGLEISPNKVTSVKSGYNSRL